MMRSQETYDIIQNIKKGENSGYQETEGRTDGQTERHFTCLITNNMRHSLVQLQTMTVDSLMVSFFGCVLASL